MKSLKRWSRKDAFNNRKIDELKNKVVEIQGWVDIKGRYEKLREVMRKLKEI